MDDVKGCGSPCGCNGLVVVVVAAVHAVRDDHMRFTADKVAESSSSATASVTPAPVFFLFFVFVV